MKDFAITVYGDFRAGSWMSRGAVSRGLAQGLVAHGWKVHVMHDGRSAVEDLDIPEGCRRAQISPMTPYGLAIGGTPDAITPRLSRHAYRAALLVAESEVLPERFAPHLRQLHLVAVPSKFCAVVYKHLGMNPGRVIVVPHGLDPAFAQGRVVPALGPSDRFRFLHMTGGVADTIARKGTPELLEAFWRFAPSVPAELHIRVPLYIDGDPERRTALGGWLFEWQQSHRRQGSDVVLEDAVPLAPAQMVEYLAGGGWSALVQPSRAEGFGMLPLQARAVGLPCILTHITGHAMHAENWDTAIVSSSRTKTVTGLRGVGKTIYPLFMRAVSPEDILRALRNFASREPEARCRARTEAAEGYGGERLWPAMTTPLNDCLRRGDGA